MEEQPHPNREKTIQHWWATLDPNKRKDIIEREFEASHPSDSLKRAARKEMERVCTEQLVIEASADGILFIESNGTLSLPETVCPSQLLHVVSNNELAEIDGDAQSVSPGVIVVSNGDPIE